MRIGYLVLLVLGVLMVIGVVLVFRARRVGVPSGVKMVSGVNQESGGGEKMTKLSGKKILLVVAPKDYRDEELSEPRAVFEGFGAVVTVASKGVAEALGSLGGKVTVDKDITVVSAGDFDAIVFVGGPGATVYFDDPAVQKIARDAVQQNEVVGAICIAPSILANAGVLEGKQATAFSSEVPNLKAKGASYVVEDVVRDGKIVTASGPSTARAFGEKIAAVLDE